MKGFNIFTGEAVDFEFATQTRRPVKDESEKPNPKSQTEQAYVPPQIQIQDMMDAGVRLLAYRRARFDSTELELGDEEDVPLDPTSGPNVDLVDIKKAGDAVMERLSSQKAAADEKQAAKEKSEKEAAEKARIEGLVKEELKKLAAPQEKAL